MRLNFEKIKGVIFDIDGTLIDTMPIWQDICALYLKSIGIEPEPNLNEIVFTMTIKEGCKYTKEHYKLDKSEEEIEQGVIELIKHYYYEEVPAKPGVVRLVNEFATRGIPMVLATTGDEDLAMHALKRIGIWDKFEKLFTCGSLNTSKREPLVFLTGKKELEKKIGHEVSVSEILVLDDSPAAVKTTKDAGFTVAGIADDACSQEWKSLIDMADYFYYSLDEAFGDEVCPCCRQTVFSEEDSYEICRICDWENDGLQKRDPEFAGGANKPSLIEYIRNFKKNV